MLDRCDLWEYQNQAVNFIKTKNNCLLMLDMGLGKTAISLTVAHDYLNDLFVSNVLIIAPLRVANTVWKQESQKWKHLRDLDITICTGSHQERVTLLNTPSDIHIINVDNVTWLVDNVPWRWDMLIIDESSKFKGYNSKRFKSLKKVCGDLKSVVELTGTPLPNGYMDLWSQIYLIDRGARLGRNITIYRNRYFYQESWNKYSYNLKSDSENKIKNSIKDVCITMKAKDYLDVPSKIDVTKFIDLPKEVVKQYKHLEKEFILLINKVTIEVPTAATLANKLLQLCNGTLYDSEKNTHTLHDCKIDVLRDIVEQNPNENLLVAYNYKSDLHRIRNAFPSSVVLDKKGDELLRWNAGKIKMLLAHPASAGYGLNAQEGGHTVVWFGLNWSLELYQQFNARIHRQGQDKPVKIIHIVCRNTIDETVLKAIGDKSKTQKELLDYLKLKK